MARPPKPSLTPSEWMEVDLILSTGRRGDGLRRAAQRITDLRTRERLTMTAADRRRLSISYSWLAREIKKRGRATQEGVSPEPLSVAEPSAE